MTQIKTHGSGKFKRQDFKKIGQNVIFEKGVLIFHPENIVVGDKVYVGHQTILKGYYKNNMIIDDGVWIGQQCFIHSAGGVEIGRNVGIGPGVKIISSSHENDENITKPIIHSKITLKKVVIKDNSDIGTGAIILPGVIIGRGVQIGAGAVVTKNIPDYEIWAGVPARRLRKNANRR